MKIEGETHVESFPDPVPPERGAGVLYKLNTIVSGVRESSSV